MESSHRSMCFRNRLITEGCWMNEMTFMRPSLFGHFRTSTSQIFFLLVKSPFCTHFLARLCYKRHSRLLLCSLAGYVRCDPCYPFKGIGNLKITGQSWLKNLSDNTPETEKSFTEIAKSYFEFHKKPCSGEERK